MSRILSAAILIVILGATLFLLPAWATLVLAGLVAAGAGAELAIMSRSLGVRAPEFFAAAAAAGGAFALGAPDYWPGTVTPEATLLFVIAAALATGLVVLGSMPPGPGVPVAVAVLMLAAFYVGLPLGTLAAIRAVSGPETLVWLVAVIAISDTAQYYTGRTFGRRKLAPAVSPGKTVEGAIGGLVAAPLAAALLASWGLPGASMVAAAAAGLALAGFGIAGDLFESLLKRSAGVKDSSALIPGHGGVLDRIDAYLFAAPAFYLLMRFVK